jgi:hypothetical protein
VETPDRELARALWGRYRRDMTRMRLLDVRLVGAAALFRSFMFWCLAALAAIGALGYVMPAHRVRGDIEFHSNYADGGPFSLLVFALVIGVALALRRHRFGAGMIAGATASVGAVLALGPVFLVHFLSTVEDGPGEVLFAMGVLGCFFGGAIALVAEPILYVVERRRLEREAAPPSLPVARIVA